MQRSALFAAPASSIHAFANQMADIVSALPEKVAPLHIARRRQPKSIIRWLSPTAISAKRERRRLANLWKRCGAESDRIACRHQCRTTKKIINQARRDHNSQHINSCTDSKSRWTDVRELLHSSDNRRFTSDEENLKLCDSFSNFFLIKILNLKQSIKAKLGSPIIPPPPPDAPFNGTPLSTLPFVTPAEVSKLLSTIQSKSSSMDYIPTSLLQFCNKVFSHSIAPLANLSFSEGCFSSDFKADQITPLLKNRTRHQYPSQLSPHL